jgi:hypothetical protein
MTSPISNHSLSSYSPVFSGYESGAESEEIHSSEADSLSGVDDRPMVTRFLDQWIAHLTPLVENRQQLLNWLRGLFRDPGNWEAESDSDAGIRDAIEMFREWFESQAQGYDFATDLRAEPDSAWAIVLLATLDGRDISDDVWGPIFARLVEQDPNTALIVARVLEGWWPSAADQSQSLRDYLLDGTEMMEQATNLQHLEPDMRKRFLFRRFAALLERAEQVDWLEWLQRALLLVDDRGPASSLSAEEAWHKACKDAVSETALQSLQSGWLTSVIHCLRAVKDYPQQIELIRHMLVTPFDEWTATEEEQEEGLAACLRADMHLRELPLLAHKLIAEIVCTRDPVVFLALVSAQPDLEPTIVSSFVSDLMSSEGMPSQLDPKDGTLCSVLRALASQPLEDRRATWRRLTESWHTLGYFGADVLSSWLSAAVSAGYLHLEELDPCQSRDRYLWVLKLLWPQEGGAGDLSQSDPQMWDQPEVNLVIEALFEGVGMTGKGVGQGALKDLRTRNPSHLVLTAVLSARAGGIARSGLGGLGEGREAGDLLSQELMQAMVFRIAQRCSEENVPQDEATRAMWACWLTAALWLLDTPQEVETILQGLQRPMLAQVLVQGAVFLQRGILPKTPWFLDAFVSSLSASPGDDLHRVIEGVAIAAHQAGQSGLLHSRLLQRNASKSQRALLLAKCLESSIELPTDLIRQLINQTGGQPVHELVEWVPILNAWVMQHWGLGHLQRNEITSWCSNVRSFFKKVLDQRIPRLSSEPLILSMIARLPHGLYLWERGPGGRRASEAAMRIQWAMDEQLLNEDQRIVQAFERSLFTPTNFAASRDLMPFFDFTFLAPNGESITLQDLVRAEPDSQQMAAFIELAPSFAPELRYAVFQYWLAQGPWTTDRVVSWFDPLFVEPEHQRKLALAFFGVAAAFSSIAHSAIPPSQICAGLQEWTERDLGDLISCWKGMRMPGDRGLARAVQSSHHLVELINRIWQAQGSDLIGLSLWDQEPEIGLFVAIFRMARGFQTLDERRMREFSPPNSEQNAELALFHRTLRNRERFTLVNPALSDWYNALAQQDVARILNIEPVLPVLSGMAPVAGLLSLLSVPADRWAAADQLALRLGFWQTRILNAQGGLWGPLLTAEKIFRFMMNENRALQPILARVIRQQPLILRSPWLETREQARALAPPAFQNVIPAEAGLLAAEDESQRSIGVQLEQVLKTDFVEGQSIDWIKLHDLVQLDLQSLYVDPAAALGRVPADWEEKKQACLKRTFDLWKSLAANEVEVTQVVDTFNRIQGLLNRADTPRGEPNRVAFKDKWIKTLYCSGATPNLTAEQKTLSIQALYFGMLDVQEGTCPAGWNQVLSAIERALRVEQDFKSCVTIRLGGLIFDRAVHLFGRMIRTPQDAHLKHKIVMALNRYPSLQSIGGLSENVIQNAWADKFSLQDQADEGVPWPNLAREANAPRVPDADLPPPMRNLMLDPKVLHLFREQMPLVLTPAEAVDAIGELLLQIPLSGDNLDLNSALTECFQGLYGENFVSEDEPLELYGKVRQAARDVRELPEAERIQRIRPLAMVAGVLLGCLHWAQPPAAAAAAEPEPAPMAVDDPSSPGENFFDMQQFFQNGWQDFFQ